jgi:hypothetical protein
VSSGVVSPPGAVACPCVLSSALTAVSVDTLLEGDSVVTLGVSSGIALNKEKPPTKPIPEGKDFIGGDYF